MCNQAGGSDNANFVRGNQFGVDYDFDNLYNKKMLEYRVEIPVQEPMQLQNPEIVYNNKPNFFPNPTLELRSNKDYITPPYENNYTQNYQPTYVSPYKTLNSQTISKNELDEKDTDKLNNPNYVDSYTVEKFENYTNNNLRNFVIIALFIMIVLYILSLYRKK